MLFLTTGPTIFNIFNFTVPGWWSKPSLSYDFVKIVPTWWGGIYPITYYFIGCYLKEFTLKLSQKRTALLIILFTLVFGIYHFYRNYGNVYHINSQNDWQTLSTVVISVLVFSLISNINTDKLGNVSKRVLEVLSNCVFGAYLVLYIFDSIIYSRLREAIPMITSRFSYYPIVTIVIFICSLLLSYCLNLIYKLGRLSIIKILTRFKNHKKLEVK